MAANFVNGFDHASGIRERLALVAQLGTNFNPAMWGYHTHRDYWYYCGPERTGRIVKVVQEGSRSLELIAERWHMDRKAAMALIGYPEGK